MEKWEQVLREVEILTEKLDTKFSEFNGSETQIPSHTNRQAYNHIGKSLSLGVDALSLLALSQPTQYDCSDAVFQGDPSFDRIQTLTKKACIDLLAAIKTVAKQPERGRIIKTPNKVISAQQLVTLVLSHVEIHLKDVEGERPK